MALELLKNVRGLKQDLLGSGLDPELGLGFKNGEMDACVMDVIEEMGVN